MSFHDEDNECRVCRGGPEEERPLYTPCLCKGSIGQVHQTCLEEWLAHSHKEVCELCHTKYQFIPCYAPTMPNIIPLQTLILTTIQHILPTAISILARFHMTMFVWLFLMPLCTCWLYRIWLPRAALFASVEDGTLSILKDIVSGMTIAAVIATSFVVIMSFTDFLRNHWDLDHRRNNPRPRRNRFRQGNNNVRPVRPIQRPVPVPPIVNNNNNINIDDDLDRVPDLVGFDVEDSDDEDQGAPAAPPRPVLARIEHEDINAMDEAAILNAINNEDDAEMQMALDELIGLRGPWHIALRNVMWLLLFNSIYIGIFAFVPYNIGLSATLAMRYYFDSTISQLVALYLPPEYKDTFFAFLQLSSESKNDLQLPTIFIIFFGFGLTASVAFLGGLIMSQMHSNLPRLFINHYVLAFNELTMIIKVGILLFQRIFVLPIALGLVILACFQGFLEYPSMSWIEFMAHNMVGFLALAWTMGISFMLTVTLTVLQLREVLHPDILAKIIRPQEAHAELLKSLKQESTLTHTRRTCGSMLVYLVILLLFVYVPIQLCRGIAGSMFPLHIRVWYFLPEIQLPVELCIAHIAFLTLFEQKKDVIGKLEHEWFKFVSTKLGINRVVLPYAQILKPDGRVVLEPLPRPAHNWDAHNGDANVSRWAWGEEQLADVELAVAPRELCEGWMKKSVVLVMLSWLAVVAVELFGFFAPLMLGKFLWFALQIPGWLHHDPLCYLAGSGQLFLVLIVYKEVCSRQVISKLYQSIRGIPSNILAKLAGLLAFHLFNCSSFGISITLAKSIASSDLAFFTLGNIGRDILLAIALVHIWLFFCMHGLLDSVMTRFHLPNPVATWAEDAWVIETQIFQVCLEKDWSRMHTLVVELHGHLMLPLYHQVFLKSLLPAPLVGCLLCPLAYSLTNDVFSKPYPLAFIVVKGMSLYVFASFVKMGGLAAEIPLKVLGEYIYCMVRDKKYLIGKRLRSMPQLAMDLRAAE